MTVAHALIVGFPAADADDPGIWHVRDGMMTASGVLSDIADIVSGYDMTDAVVMAVVTPAQARCIWASFPDLEPRQAEGVAKLRAHEQSIGVVHAVARHINGDIVLAATIASATMEYGLLRLAAYGLNPDIVIPAGLTIDAPAEGFIGAIVDGAPVLRGAVLAVPDEPALRTLLVGDATVKEIDAASVQSMIIAAAQYPALNLRDGVFAKRERYVFTTPQQRKWIIRLIGGLVLATLLLGIVAWAKYSLAAGVEDDLALTAAQKIDPAITDITQAEAQLDRALQQKGLSQGRFAPLSAGLWRSVKAAPNVSIRELRYEENGMLSVVLAAPDADSINKALLAVQRDGFRITATPRQDTSGATLVDLTVRMP